MEFLGKGCLKAKKDYTSYLQEGIKSYFIFIASTNFGTTKSRRLIKNCMESSSLSNHCQTIETQLRLNQWQDSGFYLTASSSFTNAFDILNIILLPIKAFTMGHLL